MKDLFRPHFDPARSIYDAFQAEAENRRGRTPEEWTAAEASAVLRAATQAAEIFDLRAPSMEEVLESELLARGHTDYGAKWVYRVVEQMRAGRTRCAP